MKIKRDITRNITVTPDEIYAALVTRYDLPSLGEGAAVWIEDSNGVSVEEVMIQVQDRTEQEL